MHKILLISVLLLSAKGFAQNTMVKERYQTMQGQDMTVPPPPDTTFPAVYPEGNKVFIEQLKKMLDATNTDFSKKKLSTRIILKIDAEGNVLNISTYGSDQEFNKQVKQAAKSITGNKQWSPGKNAQGIKVIDIVNLPFKH